MRFSCSAVFSTVIGLAASSLLLAQAPAPAKAPAPPPKAPDGFTVLFNGKDLSGWRGRPGGGGVFSPYVEAKFTPEEREAKRKEWNADRDLHWSVDPASGELVSDGRGCAPGDGEGVRRLRVPRRLEADAAERRFRHLPPRFPAGADLGSCESARAAERRRQGVGRPVEQQPGQPRAVPVGQGGQPHRPVEHPDREDGRHARVGHAQRPAGRRWSGARQLLRAHAAGAADRLDRAADARIGSPLPQHLRARDPARPKRRNCSRASRASNVSPSSAPHRSRRCAARRRIARPPRSTAGTASPRSPSRGPGSSSARQAR